MVGLKSRDSTTQDGQKAKKLFDEEAEIKYLPPGLINQGNTCFMNSVLQGLISTRILADMIQFAPLPSGSTSSSITPIASWRSPQITNGHGQGGQHEQPWTPGMPIGDVFVAIMLKAWDIQKSRRRENISPRELLTAVGQKHDQYLDFAQQDAHEFLRQLLDAMRMEEFDIIKKRQPPPAPSQDKSRKHRRQTIKPTVFQTLTPPQDSNTPNAFPPTTPTSPSHTSEEDRLVSFVDMVFGGKLTSILVCEKCKHISQTQEDFNDLSLSIKPDDYGKGRRRGRFRALAKRVAALQSATRGVHSFGRHRSSSVPPSPREATPFPSADELPITSDPRRRSLDILATMGSSEPAATGMGATTTRETSPERETGHSSSASVAEDGMTDDDSKRVSFAEKVKAEKKGNKEKGDDGWVKLGRRITMSIRLGKDKDRPSRSRNRYSMGEVLDISSARSKEAEEHQILAGSLSAPSTSASHVQHDLYPPETRSPPKTAQHLAEKPKLSNRHSDYGPSALSPPQLPLPSRFPTIQHLTNKHPRSPQPPKPTLEEAAYLRQILADITPASASPFTIFRSNSQFGANGVTASSATSAYALWLKMGQLPGVEECLRMFTSVEILEGENMVGCRRCWKIANGMYTRHSATEGEDDSDSEDNTLEDEVQQGAPKIEQSSTKPVLLSSTPPSSFSSNTTSVSSPSVSTDAHTNYGDGVPRSSPSTQATSPSSSSSALQDYPQSLIFQKDLSPVSTLPELQQALPTAITAPTAPHETTPLPPAHVQSLLNQGVREGIEDSEVSALDLRIVTIPSISMTAPQSPALEPLAELQTTDQEALQPSDTPSGDSLLTPKVHHRRPKESDFFDGTCESSEADSDASTGTSVFERSASSSPSLVSPDLSAEQSASHSKESSSVSKVKRSKEVIMRAAYKRYLIGTPPPVLVIHLKRFQQVSKTHMMSFSHGLKKLDDYVTFPEYLDLTPFLAPKKEDYGLGRKGLSARIRAKDRGRCMYRLYAVVVHIGNMLGGHYVAYTALPATFPSADKTSQAASAPPSHPEPTSATYNKTPRQWAYISDTVVRLTTIEEVLKVKAYICMYERI